MAKSFYNILGEGSITVRHIGEDVDLELPGWLNEAANILEDEEKLVEWATDNEVMHGLLHSAIQQEIIRIRAAARPTVKSYADVNKYNEALRVLNPVEEWNTSEKDCQISRKISYDVEGAQERINDYVCKPVVKPGTTKTKVVSTEDAIGKLVADGLSIEDIMKKIQAAKEA